MMSFLYLVGLIMAVLNKDGLVMGGTCNYGLYSAYPLVDGECSTDGDGTSVKFECDDTDTSAGMVYYYTDSGDCSSTGNVSMEAVQVLDCATGGSCDVYTLTTAIYPDDTCTTAAYTSTYYLSGGVAGECIAFDTKYFEVSFSDGLSLNEYSDDSCSTLVNTTSFATVGTCVAMGDLYATTTISVDEADAALMQSMAAKSVVVLCVVALYNLL